MKCVSVRSDLAIDTKIDGGAARYTRGEGHRVLYVYNFEQTLDFVSLTVIASTRKGNEISKPCFDHTSFPILPRNKAFEIVNDRLSFSIKVSETKTRFKPDPPLDGKSNVSDNWARKGCSGGTTAALTRKRRKSVFNSSEIPCMCARIDPVSGKIFVPADCNLHSKMDRRRAVVLARLFTAGTSSG